MDERGNFGEQRQLLQAIAEFEKATRKTFVHGIDFGWLFKQNNLASDGKYLHISKQGSDVKLLVLEVKNYQSRLVEIPPFSLAMLVTCAHTSFSAVRIDGIPQIGPQRKQPLEW